MERSQITIELRNIREPENRRTLIAVGKKDQVPCLFIGGTPLYESNDIIAYLKHRLEENNHE